MWKLYSVLFLAAISLLTLACGNETAEEASSSTAQVTEPAPAPVPTAAPPPAKAEIKCVEDTNKRLSKAGDLMRCKLAETVSVDSYACKGGYMLELHPGGMLKQCSLEAPRDVEGFSCQSGLSLYQNGKFRRCKLEADKEIGGVQLKARDWVTISEDGTLYRVELAAGPRDLKGFPCKGYMNFFHNNGQLGKCTLDEDKTIGNTPHKAGESICWDEAGEVTECKLLSWNMGW